LVLSLETYFASPKGSAAEISGNGRHMPVGATGGPHMRFDCHAHLFFLPYFLINQPAQQSGGQLPNSHCFEICSRSEASSVWYVERPRAAAGGIFVIKGEYGMTLSALTGFGPSHLIFEGNFADPALDSNWHSYITSNAANGWHTESVAATFRSMKAPSGDA
jgi:hypothetical protein